MGPPALRRDVRVSYQGVEHAYSHQAASAYADRCGLAAELVGCPTFRAALAELTAGDADLAVLPVENTTAGSITGVYDLLLSTGVAVVGEQVWRIDHCLAAPPGATVGGLRRVLSHPQALEQCSDFLATRGLEPVSWVDTADALRHVAEQRDPALGAIGSADAAAAHGLPVLASGIANQAENWTRFLVLAREPVVPQPGGSSKTSLVLSTRHEHGALLRCLHVLDAHDLSMTKLESRPVPGRPFEYLFFVDVEGTVADPAVAAALAELADVALDVRLLGSYPTEAVPLPRR
jgi:chorismate mutase / prephenate dehydratase